MQCFLSAQSLQQFVLEHFLRDMRLIIRLQLHAEILKLGVQHDVIRNHDGFTKTGTFLAERVQFLRDLIYAVLEVRMIVRRSLSIFEYLVPRLHQILFVGIQCHSRKVVRSNGTVIEAEFILIVATIGTVEGQALVLIREAGINQTGLQKILILLISSTAVG